MASQADTTVNGQDKRKYACRPCRSRKIKCDGTQPVCSTCSAHERQCEYDRDGPRRRSRVPGSRRAERERRRTMRLSAREGEHHTHAANRQDHSAIVDSFPPQQSPAGSKSRHPHSPEPYAAVSEPSLNGSQAEDETQLSSQVDVNEHLVVDPSGNIEARGPTNTLYEPLHRHRNRNPGVPEHYTSAILTANTALEQQKEPGYKQVLIEQGYIEGVPAELALHLLDIHWSRHHFFLITYRPAFYRDMMNGGPYYSPLLLFAILAVSSRYSERPEVGGGDHSAHSGKDFYDKARARLAEDMEKSTIPTATALLLMGNALVSAGQVDKGWLYTGMGIRMIMNLGLHLDVDSYATSPSKRHTPEEIEIRRRLFWGAFVCEKLQSLYLGRPFLIHKCDTHVPKKFLDMYEEGQIWRPIPDLSGSRALGVMSTNSITTFTNICLLAEICGDIMTSFYAIKAKSYPRKVLHASRARIRRRLSSWETNLPDVIKFTPWETGHKQKTVPIHVIVLHTVYLSLLILLERPFVENGHLSSSEDNIGSWGECTIAAEKVSHILYAYRRSYSFRRIPYQLCYTTYVASTILVRNMNKNSGSSTSIKHLAICLKAFEEMKLLHPGSSRMEAIIRSLMSRLGVNVDDQFLDSINNTTTTPSSDGLPNPDFDASTRDAIQNRNINIDTIRQSFAFGSAPESLSIPSGVADAASHPRQAYMQPVDATSVGPILGLDSGLGYDDVETANHHSGSLGWNYSFSGLDDDLLFGVLGSDWT